MKKKYNIENIKTGVWYKAINNEDQFMDIWYDYFFEIGEKVDYLSLFFNSDPDDEEYDVTIRHERESSYEFLEFFDLFNFEKIEMPDNIKRYIMISCFNYD